jgi:hemolysin D
VALHTEEAALLVDLPSDASLIQIEAAASAMRAQAAEQAAKSASLDQQIAHKQGEADEAIASLAKLQASLQWVEQQAQIRQDAKDIQFGNKLTWMEAEQHLAEMRHDLEITVVRQREAVAARGALERQHEQAAAEYEKTILGDLAKAEQQASQSAHDLAKAEQRLQLQTLRAPIDGTVQQLAVHTVGGVVTPEQALLVVAPDDPGLIVEAQVENGDVGFVHPGQPVEVKVETFTFTRYGLLHGRVVDVSRDSVSDNASQPRRQSEDDKDTDKTGSAAKVKPPAYIAHVALDRTSFPIEAHEETLASGMSVTAEIKTGRRTVTSYLMSPLRRYAHDGIRER